MTVPALDHFLNDSDPPLNAARRLVIPTVSRSK